MKRIEEIENAINSLPEEEYRQLRRWFLKKDWMNWDRQLESDINGGKLDFLRREALEEKKTGKLKDL